MYKRKRQTDEIIYHENILNWYYVECALCKDRFLVKNNQSRAKFCSCDVLIKSQAISDSVIYIAKNEDDHIKVGLSQDGNRVINRIKSINRQINKLDLKAFDLIHIFRVNNRALAFSVERLIHTELKVYKLYKIKPYQYEGQGEVYDIKLLPFVFALLDYIKMIDKECSPC